MSFDIDPGLLALPGSTAATAHARNAADSDSDSDSPSLSTAKPSCNLRTVAQRFFSINELVSIVLKGLREEREYGTLLAVALFQKSCKECAIDALWHTLPSFDPVIELLSLEVSARSFDLDTSLYNMVWSPHPDFCPLPFGIDAEVHRRLLRYTSRTKELHIPSLSDPPFLALHDDGPVLRMRNVLEALRRTTRSTGLSIFPNAELLQTSGQHLDIPIRISPLIGERLTFIDIMDVPPTAEITSGYIASIPDGEKTWNRLSPKITCLHVSMHLYPVDHTFDHMEYWESEDDEYDTNRPHEVERLKRARYQKRLRFVITPQMLSSSAVIDVRLPPWDDQTMQALSRLPALKTLQLDFLAFQPTSIYSGSAASRDRPFSKLESLRINFYDRDPMLYNSASDLLQAYFCFPTQAFNCLSFVPKTTIPFKAERCSACQRIIWTSREPSHHDCTSSA